MRSTKESQACKIMDRKPITVFIAEDSHTIRIALRAELAKAPDIEVIGESDNGRTAVDEITRLKPDVALIDLGLPQLGGAEATKQVKARVEGIKIMIVTSQQSQQSVIDAFGAGADGYYVKTDKKLHLVPAVRTIYAGAGWLHPQIASMVLRTCAHTAARISATPTSQKVSPTDPLKNVSTPRPDNVPGLSTAARKRTGKFATSDEQHSVISLLLMMAASAEQEQNDLNAEALYFAALASAEKLLGGRSLDAATLATKLGDFYYERDNFARAEPLYMTALEIRHAGLGQENLDVAKSLENLANLYDNSCDYAQAERYYLWSLNIREKLKQPELTAETCLKVAWVCRAQGKIELAEQMEQRAGELKSGKQIQQQGAGM